MNKLIENVENTLVGFRFSQRLSQVILNISTPWPPIIDLPECLCNLYESNNSLIRFGQESPSYNDPCSVLVCS